MEPIQRKEDSLWSRFRGRGIVYGADPRMRDNLWGGSRGGGIVYGADSGEVELFMEPIQ